MFSSLLICLFLLFPLYTLSRIYCDIQTPLDSTVSLNYCYDRYRSTGLKKGDYCLIRPERVRPTQVFVGKVEMECTKSLFESYTSDQLRVNLMENNVPTVIGPKAEFYITDHHHFAVALFQAFLDFQRPVIHRVLYACIQEDYSQYNKSSFWKIMKERQFVFLEDERGNSITTDDLPVTLKLMADNPFRTLASWLRKGFVYIKCGSKKTKHALQCKNSTAPFFLECIWADYIRKFIPLTYYPSWPDSPLDDFIYRASLQLQVEALVGVMNSSMSLALSTDAINLPGFNFQRDILTPTMVKIDNHGCPPGADDDSL